MVNRINTVRVKAVANALSHLKSKVVFVGGAIVSFYPDKPIIEVRPTDDVDVIIEILSYSNRSKLEEKLREIGFTNDIESGIICRYRIHGIIVDIMPTNDRSIGFTNKWYQEGFNQAINYIIDERTVVHILAPPYFIATKLEAYKSRGGRDGRTSQDFEDIVLILENRTVIWDEMNRTNTELLLYLRKEFKTLLKNPNLFEWIDCHVERVSPPATYTIIESMKVFVL